MCTLIVAHKTLSTTPLLVGDNRDERYDRRSEPARWWTPRASGPLIWAPRDVRAGGTWIGVNEYGVFAGLTNRFGAHREEAPRSRGEVVIEALMHGTSGKAAEAIAQVAPAEFSGFHLLVADRHQAHLVWHDGAALHAQTLSPGVHIVTERSLGAAESAREDFVRAQTDALLRAGSLDVMALKELLGTQQGHHFDDVRVHIPSRNYGTRSSTIVQFAHQADSPDLLLFKEGGYTSAHAPSRQHMPERHLDSAIDVS